MQRYRVAVNGEEFKVQLIEKSANSLRFTLDDEPYTVDLAPVFEERVIALTTTASDTAQGSAIAPVKASAKAGTITAPMPGIVVSFSVKEGDTVQRGQTVCVIEAMKMENNISSPRDGTVRTIGAKPGQEVQQHQMLVEIS